MDKNSKIDKTDQPEKLSFKDCFDAPSYDQWRREADRLLNDQTEAASRAEMDTPGFNWQPIFRREELERGTQPDSYSGLPSFEQSAHRPKSDPGHWTVLQNISSVEPDQFNRSIREGLEHGLSGILVRFDRAGRLGLDPDQARVGDVGWGGLSIATVDELASALEGIELDHQPIHFDCGPNPLVGISYLVTLFEKANLPLAKLRGGLFFDPLGWLAAEGILPAEISQIYDEMAMALKWSGKLEHFQTATISTVPYQESGLTAAEQLGSLLATGVTYLREMEARGISPEKAQSELSFTISVGTNLFVEIAKLRACRQLWSRLMELSGIPDSIALPKIHVTASDSTRTVHDRHVNLLRGTAQAFASIVGDCASLTITSPDQAASGTDNFSLRLARNTQLILAEESHLGAVIDPAGGSYYLEQLTDSIAEQAWNKFREIETMGGMLHSLQAGLIHQWISEAVNHRSERLARRKDVIVGTSRYVDLAEEELAPKYIDLEKYYDKRHDQIVNYKAAKKRPITKARLGRITKAWSSDRDSIITSLTHLARDGATVGELAASVRGDATESVRIGPLTPFRLSEMFEHLRGMVANHSRREGDHPGILISAIGQGNGLQSRIEFVRDYFAVAGYATKFEKIYATADEALHAVKQNDPALVVLIAADKDYPDLVPPLSKLIKEHSDNTAIALAGYPEGFIDSFTDAGVSEFIYDGADICAGLMRLSHLIGVLP